MKNFNKFYKVRLYCEQTKKGIRFSNFQNIHSIYNTMILI